MIHCDWIGKVKGLGEQHVPVADAGRIEIADVLRGFAVCGILFVNIMYFKAPGAMGTFVVCP